MESMNYKVSEILIKKKVKEINLIFQVFSRQKKIRRRFRKPKRKVARRLSLKRKTKHKYSNLLNIGLTNKTKLLLLTRIIKTNLKVMLTVRTYTPTER
jgi:hypothetical protein